MMIKNGVYYNAKNNKIYTVTNMQRYLGRDFGLLFEFNVCDGESTDKVLQIMPVMLDHVIYLGAL